MRAQRVDELGRGGAMRTGTGVRRGGVAVLIAMVAGLPLGGLTGCTNPLFPDASDYGAEVRAERLKRIDQAQFARYRTNVRPADVTPTREMGDRLVTQRFEGVETVELGLEQARESALANNLDLKVALVDPAIARENVSREDAAFESIFRLRTLIADSDAATASTLESGQSNVRQITPSVSVPLRTGETFTIGAPIQRTKRDLVFSTLNPAYTSDLEFSISQPLLRGAGRRANTAALRIASYDERASAAQTKLEAIRQLAAVDRSYWRLYGARRALDVSVQQYQLATAQQERAQRRVDAGDVAEIEVIRAQAGVSDQVDAIITAQNDILTQQRELKRIINMPGLDVQSAALVMPATEPDPVRYEFDRDELLTAAVRNRMELLALEVQLAADAARIDLNKNRALPLFTLDYAYRINGLGSSGQDSFRSLEGNNFADWSIGLNAEIPLGNEAAQAAVRQAILQRVQRLYSKEARTQTIRQEVLAATDQIEAAWQRILAARASVILNTRSLRAEERQFDVGQSTSTNVLDAAARLAEAQLQEIRAIVDYEIAQVDLAFATGTVLGATKVALEPPGRPDPETPTPAEEIPSEATWDLPQALPPAGEKPVVEPRAEPVEGSEATGEGAVSPGGTGGAGGSGEADGEVGSGGESGAGAAGAGEPSTR